MQEMLSIWLLLVVAAAVPALKKLAVAVVAVLGQCGRDLCLF